MRVCSCLFSTISWFSLFITSCAMLPRNTATVYLRNNDFQGLDEDLSYCQTMFKRYDDGFYDLDWRLIADFAGIPHYQSRWVSACLELRGWRPAMQFANHRFKGDKELFADVLACGADQQALKYRLVSAEAGGAMLYGICQYLREGIRDGGQAATQFSGCLAGKGWELKFSRPWYTFADDDRDRVLVNYPLTPLNAVSAEKLRPSAAGIWDEGAGITWLGAPNPVSGWYSWRSANSLIAGLNKESHLGCQSWRLPRRDELEGLLRLASGNALGDMRELLRYKGFGELPTGVFWTSTPAGDDTVWGLNIETGTFVKMYTTEPFAGVILPVHGGWRGGGGTVSSLP
jgi:uncharacterized protein DUF1566